jgi:hypothetical protein
MKTFLSLAALVLCSSIALGNEFFVDQKAPSAADKNPGTEALPLKTLQAAVDLVKPGDTIWVKAGRYEEPVHINKTAEYNAPITLSAWKDDRVCIGFQPRALPSQGKWTPLPGSKSFAIKLTEPLLDNCVIVLNDKGVNTVHRDTPPRDDKTNWACYRNSDKTVMFNANGKDPATLGEFKYGRANMGVPDFWVDQKTAWWVFKKLQFSWLCNGIHLCADNCVVEDCFFTKCYRVGCFLHGRTNTVQRCNFYRCGSALAGSFVGPAALLDNNMIVECGLSAEDDIMIGFTKEQEDYNWESGGGPTCFKGNNMGMTFAYNILSENTGGAGWYADIDAECCRILGNAFWDNPGGGIYNEYGIDDTTVIGNTFYRCGATAAMCTRFNVVENYFYQSGLSWCSREWWMLRDSYMLSRKNVFNNPTYGYLLNYGKPFTQEGFVNSISDFNRIYQDGDAALLCDSGTDKVCRTLDDIRKTYGFEMHGQVTPYRGQTADEAVAPLGGSVVTFRVPWGKRTGEARPMLSNADFECRWPAAPQMISVCQNPAFFWRVADGTYDNLPLWGSFEARHNFHSRWQPSSMVGYRDKGNTAGCRWYVEADLKFSPEVEKKVPRDGDLSLWPTNVTLSQGNHWVGIGGVEPAKIPPQGVGYWSPFLGAAPGAKVTIAMKVKGMKLESGDKGSPAVWLQFTDETGQNRKRIFMVGKDDQGQMHRPELTQGDFDWKPIEETITTPQGAVRMALFFGITPCKGDVGFDDVNIHTDSAAGPTAKGEILEPRLPLAKFREQVQVDLSKVANRSLASDQAGDGKGWDDQGPTADMREVKTGKRPFGGVTFKIMDAPGSIVELKSSSVHSSDLPEKVEIPVGRKFDDLYFLHTATWVNGNEKEVFRYVIHYADGKDVTLTVSPNNMKDWTADPVARFPFEADTFTTVVETVKVPKYHQGSLYRMEWTAPLDRRAVDIKSIEFVGNGTSVPILLGITGVVEWK